MPSVQRVIEAIGPELLSPRVAPASPAATVRHLVVAEPLGHPEIRVGDLVLAVGLSEEQVVQLAADSGRQGAVALVVKEPVAGAAAVATAARDAGVALLGVAHRADWSQLFALLGSLLAADPGRAVAASLASAPGEDLFTVADAVAAIVDAPVTIEDHAARVLAYSSRQDLTDPARVATIMGRRVPDATLGEFRRRGVLRQVGKGAEPVFVPASDGMLPRLVAPVRIGEELLGSIWAVVPGPVPASRAAAFADAAAVVALHLLRRRAEEDLHRQFQRDRMAALLRGDADVVAAAEALGLPRGPHRVVAFAVRPALGATADGGAAARLSLLERLRAAGALPARAPLAEVDGTPYAVVPDDPTGGTDDWPWLTRALAPRGAAGAVAAVGGPVAGVADLPASRAQADEVLALLRDGVVAGPCLRYEQAWAGLVIRRATSRDVLGSVADAGPLATLRVHDAAHGSGYVSTLAAWLDHAGDAAAVSQALHLHRNTLRYRMRRIGEITGMSLTDPRVRLALQLQLAAHRDSAGGPSRRC